MQLNIKQSLLKTETKQGFKTLLFCKNQHFKHKTLIIKNLGYYGAENEGDENLGFESHRGRIPVTGLEPALYC